MSFTTEQERFLRENYKELGMTECARLMNCTHPVILRWAKKAGLTKVIGPRLNHPFIQGKFWTRLKSNACSRGIPVNINADDIYAVYIKQNKRCALTGWSVTFGKTDKDTTASVDRIKSDMGYEINNIQIVHKDVNCAKWDFSESRFYEICDAVSRNRRTDFTHQEVMWQDDVWNDTAVPVQTTV